MKKLQNLIQKPFVILALGAVLAGGAAVAGMNVLPRPSIPSFNRTSAVMAPASIPNSEAMSALKQMDQVFADLAASVSEAVVNIKSDGTGEGGTGSGFVYKSDGWIITNDHVAGGRQEVTVVLQDGREFKGKVYQVNDDQLDIALVKIDASGLKTLEIADSDDVRPGQYAMAIGSPFGLQSTVTIGHVSATNRPGAVRDPETGQLRKYQGMIQTDASINPGNSGGPLLDIDGRVIGVNSTIFSMSGTSAGVGFAIPGNTVRVVGDEIIRTGKFDRGALGITFQEDIKPYKLKELGLTGGALAEAVSMDGPAFKAGLRDGDVITAVNGTKVQNQTDLLLRMYERSPGDTVTVNFQRGKDAKSATVKLASPGSIRIPGQNEQQPPATRRQRINPEEFFRNAPDFFPRQNQPAPERAPNERPRLGVGIEQATPEVRGQFGIPAGAQGVVITSVAPGSPAERFGMKVGDVIETVNGKAVTTPAQLAQAMGGIKWGDSVMFSFTRYSSSGKVSQNIQVPFE